LKNPLKSEASIRYFSEKRGTREMTILLSQMTERFLKQSADQRLKALWLCLLKYDDSIWQEWFCKRICFSNFKEHFFVSSLYSESD
jgi:succinate dehydrogenase flavin-adding protein (antitoxin of CptAB toxin-antitoxin module)